ncbi:MAG TPA: TonB-dependent receptor plug domain-containing protein, partial [Bryobacteraceae bacterium]|nr:TonB-dependent receptor plug domain-containing protein [Bryobacteraceae bacterium]
PITLNARLSLGSVTESIDVHASPQRLDPTSASTATTITINEFDSIARGRNFHTILMMAPGVRHEVKSGAAGVGGLSFDGASGSENAYFIDSVEISDVLTGALRPQNSIPFEFVKQVQVQSGGFEAEFGGVTGGVVNIATRSGSNEIHGEVQYQVNSSVLNSADRGYYQRNPFDADLAEFFAPPKDDYQIRYPGVSLGGPLLRNRIFGFASYMPEVERSARTIDYSAGPRTFQMHRTRHHTLARVDFSVSPELQGSASWLWSPSRRVGALPVRDARLPAPVSDLSRSGDFVPSQTFSTSATYSPDSRWLIHFRFGYKFLNGRSNNYGVPSSPNIAYRTPANLSGLPSELIRGAGFQSNPASFAIERDVTTRHGFNVDASRPTVILGQQHLWKFGFGISRTFNDVSDGYLHGKFEIFWDEAFARGRIDGDRGRYGYYIWQDGPRHNAKATGYSQAFYIQDSWRLAPRLTIQSGVRLEREFLPPFIGEPADLRVQKPIEFGWADKIAPRLGFAWDVDGRGRWKLAGSYGLFYDLMKYTLAREAFGGDYWVSHVYRLDSPHVSALTLNNPGLLGSKITTYDNRSLPIDSAGRFTAVDPDLKPYASRELTLSLDHQLTSRMTAGVRLTSKRLLRAIEDIGVLDGNDNEVYLIGNPGFGLTRDLRSPYGALTPNGRQHLVPRAKRNYEGIEFRIEGQAAGSHLIASYTFSRLFGNYAGLANSDEAGRMEPSISRSFDLPTYYFDSSGSQQNVQGRLATDRPHVSKFFGWREVRHRWGATTLGLTQVAMSGTPDSTTVGYLTAPTFPFGRGDLGRVPLFTQTDVNAHHTFQISERLSLRLEATAMNLLNQGAVISRVTQMTRFGNITAKQLSPDRFFSGYGVAELVPPGSPNYNPLYGLPGGDPADGGVALGAGRSDFSSAFLAANPIFGAYQGPRVLRLGVRLSF